MNKTASDIIKGSVTENSKHSQNNKVKSITDYDDGTKFLSSKAYQIYLLRKNYLYKKAWFPLAIFAILTFTIGYNNEQLTKTVTITLIFTLFFMLLGVLFIIRNKNTKELEDYVRKCFDAEHGKGEYDKIINNINKNEIRKKKASDKLKDKIINQ